MKQLWQKEAEVIGGTELVQFLNEIREDQQNMMSCFEQISGHVSSQQLIIEKVLSGFPANDAEGHRRYHQSVIDRRELINKMLREVLVHIAKAGVLGALFWVGVALWKYFKISVTT